jgi:hypothetical protein
LIIHVRKECDSGKTYLRQAGGKAGKMGKQEYLSFNRACPEVAEGNRKELKRIQDTKKRLNRMKSKKTSNHELLEFHELGNKKNLYHESTGSL